MKKVLNIIILLICVITLTGCSQIGNKTMTCTRTDIDEDGFKSNKVMKVTYNSKRVIKVNATNTVETTKDNIDEQIKFIEEYSKKFNSIGGLSMKVKKVNDTNYKLIMSIDYSRFNPEKINKDLEGLDTDDNIITDKNYTIDDFKKDQLEGYDCK